jgi:hypothetical protein
MLVLLFRSLRYKLLQFYLYRYRVIHLYFHDQYPLKIIDIYIYLKDVYTQSFEKPLELK